MPRSLRIQYPGARYHVINRGNYRSDIFETEGAANAFLKALVEASSRYGWKLHAYVLMRNHYHLAIETPEPNLVEGMHWLQSTFSTRFNRLRNQRGHVFQGRYKALVMEDTSILCRVVDYIHLNPVRAGIVAPGMIEQYSKSSLPELLKKRPLMQIQCEEWLRARGDWTANAKGIKAYVAYLRKLGNDEAEQKKAGLEKLSRGWALGTYGWKQALARDLSQKLAVEGISSEEAQELRKHNWESVLANALQAEGKTSKELQTVPRMQPWKINIAKKLRQDAGAPVVWISKQLHLGKASSVRSYMSRAKINE